MRILLLILLSMGLPWLVYALWRLRAHRPAARRMKDVTPGLLSGWPWMRLLLTGLFLLALALVVLRFEDLLWNAGPDWQQDNPATDWPSASLARQMKLEYGNA